MKSFLRAKATRSKRWKSSHFLEFPDRTGRGSRVPMDFRADLKQRLPGRRVTEGPERAPHRSSLYAMGLTSQQIHQPFVGVASCRNEAAPCKPKVAASGGSTNAALHRPAVAEECRITFDLFDVAEIFKKTPYVADLKPGGRYVAKDMFEFGGIPLPRKTLRDHGSLHGETDADIGTLNVKLTNAELSERKTKWQLRQTKPTSGALWKYARQVGPAIDGAVTHPGGVHEKQCYADI